VSTFKVSSVAQTFRQSVEAQIDRSSLVTSQWIEKNFTNPKDSRKNWSFADHEFQIDIANQGDDVREVCVIKPAQTGLSTLQIRIILAFLIQHNNLKAAYVLPTSKFASEFTQSRVNPTIDDSPVISRLVSTDTDNTSLKKIGSCFLLMRGTSGTSSAISFDLDMIIVDENDFCSQTVLGSYNSRLQHSDLKLRRDFSTPTLPGYGISEKYADSSQAVRLVKCEHCSEWVELNFWTDVMIPGFNYGTASDKPMSEWRKEMAMHPGIEGCWYKCPHCGEEITGEVLNNPERRQWVDKFPGHWRRGFRVSPWDVPKYNPLQEILRSVKDYSYSDYNNFRLGLAYESAENSFLLSVILRNTVVRRVTLADLLRGGIYGVYIGVDLGKIAHVTVGLPSPRGLDIICAERVKVADLPDCNLGAYLVRLARVTRSVRMVIDAMPDYSVSLHAHQMGVGYGAEYARASGLDIYQWDDNKGVVKIERDGHFDDLAQWVNGGRVGFPVGEDLMSAHLSVLKKAKVQTSKGIEERWTSTSSEDHFGHALGYCFAGFSSVEARWGLAKVFPGVGVGKVAVGGQVIGAGQEAGNLAAAGMGFVRR
jgi:hypothetical protein